ncbi:MAG: hypothetical protein WD187_03510 [Candidatus Woykebacteria bacterium]
MKSGLAKFLTVFLSSFLIFSFVFATNVSARFIFERSRVLHEEDEATSSATKRDEIRHKIHDRVEKLREKFEEKLEARKEKLCERVESRITGRSNRLTTRAQNMTNRFDNIAGRVENYYTDKLVPAGVTVEGYDALVADIAAKSAAVDTALADAKAAIAEFDCSGDTPKGVLALFRDDMKGVLAALKAHRKSVVDLIVAVRTAKAAAEKEATSSANQ